MATLSIAVSPVDHQQGSPDAPVTLVEYGDYECPHCAAAHPVVKALQREFGDQLRFVFRNFPLSNLHPQAMSAAALSEFAAEHGRFWDMHDRLLEQDARLTDPVFDRLTEELGLPLSAMRRALADEVYSDRIRSDFRGGVRSGVNGTPTFYLNGTRFDGTPSQADLARAIHQILNLAR